MAEFRIVEVEPNVVDLYFDPDLITSPIQQIFLAPIGTDLIVGQECVLIETHKANLEVSSPVKGTVLANTQDEPLTPSFFIRALLRVKISV